jgi:very-short-patch-repair endonuclease
MQDRADMDEVAETLRFVGGVATWRILRVVHGARIIRRTATAGVIVRAARGRYVLPTASEHLRTAQSLGAILSHLSAAQHHGWAVKSVPDRAWVTVRHKRHLRPVQREIVHPRWADLGKGEVRHGVTTPLRTVLDCARGLPFDEGLAVADSALRSGLVTRAELSASASGAAGPGARRVRRVAAHADGRAANPFESVLRALAIEEGFHLTPQLQITDSGLYALVDLGSEELRLAVEADGFEHHGTRKGLRKDCRRHTEFAVFGWSSLRFAFEDVMYEQAWVRWALRSWRVVRTGGVPEDPPRRFR